MKKFTIVLVLFFATGATSGMEKKSERRMNTENNTNPLLTRRQYNRVMERWDSIATANDKAFYNTSGLLGKNEQDAALKSLKEKIDNAHEIIYGKPYRSYTDEEITKLLWR